MKTHISALTAALAVVSLLSCGHKEKATTQEESPSVDVAEAFTDSVVLHKTYPGYLSAESQATVVAQVSGRLLSRSFQPGAYVRKGQTLFSIDPTLYRDEVSRAEAALTSAISARDYAASHYAAVKKALEADAVSKMEVLNAESALQQAESDIKTCRAALSTARTNLGYCTVTAPISGYISDSEVKPGNYVNGAAQPVSLATIYDNSTLSAIFEIEGRQQPHRAGHRRSLRHGHECLDRHPLRTKLLAVHADHQRTLSLGSLQRPGSCYDTVRTRNTDRKIHAPDI